VDITIPGIPKDIGGSNPIVIIGPNGVGKTRLGVTVATQNDAERIAALRLLGVGTVNMENFDSAREKVELHLQNVDGNHWNQASDLPSLLSEILAEDSNCAKAFRNKYEESPSTIPDEKYINTRLRKIQKIWDKHFPGRSITIDYTPIVNRAQKSGKTAYSIAHMSEGERTAFYLIARVVSCRKKVIIVDEPESFLHPLLARNLWNDLENAAENIRFIYITHDIPFAVSRKNAQFVIARSETTAELLPSVSSITADVIAEILGAASFSICASRLIFCEGKTEDDSLDDKILSSWHNCSKTAIISVASCSTVRECVSVFRGQKVTNGVDVFGYIDRDGWPDSYLKKDQYIKAHIVNEIEGLFCLEPVFKALAVYQGADSEKAQDQFNAFLTEARKSFKGVTINKEILSRAKLRVETEQKSLLNPIKPNEDIEIVRKNFVDTAPAGGWPSYLEKIFTEEEGRLLTALSGTSDDFIKYFSAKTYFKIAARHLQFVPEKMVEIFCSALSLNEKDANNEQKLKKLQDAIVTAIEPYMWPRTI
jgi:energy-coupling factor transporter ATP-binding protein EcfA2